MFIGGELVDQISLEEFCTKLRALPSGFPPQATPSVFVPDAAFAYAQKAQAAKASFETFTTDLRTIDAIWETICSKKNRSHALRCRATKERWRDFRKTHYRLKAVAAFEKAAAESLYHNNPSYAGINNLEAGRLLFAEDRFDEAVRNFEKALPLLKTKGPIPALGDNIGYLYSSLIKCEQKPRTKTNNTATPLTEKLADLRQQYVPLFDHPHGEASDPWAHRIHEGAVGFSDKQRIGTTNVNQCVCLILHDPATHKTALAHVNSLTTEASLQILIDRIQPQNATTDAPLQARLIGARYDFGDPKKQSAAKKGRANLGKILGFLGKHPVDIISADLFNEEQPRSIVVDPKSFKIAEKTPDLFHPDNRCADSLACMGSCESGLRLAFDLTVSPDTMPIFLESRIIEILHDVYWKYTEAQIYEQIEDGLYFKPHQIPIIVNHIITMRDTYREAFESLSSILETQIKDIKKGDTIVSESNLKLVRDQLKNKGIYIGREGQKANQPLVDFIHNDLFALDEDHICTVNHQAFKAFALPRQTLPLTAPSRQTTSRRLDQFKGQALHTAASLHKL